MGTDNFSPADDSQQYAGQTEVTAFFDSQVDADKAVVALGVAGFSGADVSVMPRSEEEDAGAVVAVSKADRLAEAAAILQQCGGQLGRLGKGLGANLPNADEDDPARSSGIFSSSSIAGGSGAGTARGGAIF